MPFSNINSSCNCFVNVQTLNNRQFRVASLACMRRTIRMFPIKIGLLLKTILITILAEEDDVFTPEATSSSSTSTPTTSSAAAAATTERGSREEGRETPKVRNSLGGWGLHMWLMCGRALSVVV